MERFDDFSFHLANWFTRYLPGQKNLAEGTISSYRDAFKLLLRYLDSEHAIAPSKVRLSDVTAENVCGFLEWLESERGISASTRNQRLAAICSFCRYVQLESPDYIHELKRVMAIPNKRYDISPRIYLRAEDVRLILAQPDCSTATGFRDQVLLSVLYDTGARVSELIQIRIGDVRLDKPATIALHGKGGKTRAVPIMAKTVALLGQFMKERRYNPGIAKADHFLFENQRRQAMSRWGVKYVLEKHVNSARVAEPSFSKSRITPHLIRHSRASHLLQAGVNLIYIRDLLGHVDISTTEIYARADTELKRKALEGAYECLTPDVYPRWEDDSDLMSWLDTVVR